jgi:hypothetical protein
MWVTLNEAVAAVRCGHTSVDPDDAFAEAIRSRPLFPLLLHAEGGGAVVQFNGTPDDRTIRPGMRVTSVNGHAMSDLLLRFVAMVSGDGDNTTGALAHLPKLFPIFYFAAVEPTDRFVVEASDESGKGVTATLAGMTRIDPATNHNPVNAPVQAAVAKLNWTTGNLGLRFLKDPDVAEVRIRYFVGDDFPTWIRQTFQTLRDKGTRCLILDLRGNGGGNDDYGALLVSCLTDRPFRYFDRIDMKTISPSPPFKANTDWDAAHERRLRDGATPKPGGGFALTPKLHAGLSEQQPAKAPFLGTVFVLTDGGTFSTAADFCAVVQHLKRATFIGEETGGGYAGNNSGMIARLTLPNSGFRARIPMYQYWNAVPTAGEAGRHGTLPDHAIETTVSDLVRGKDAPLDLAVQLSSGG